MNEFSLIWIFCYLNERYYYLKLKLMRLLIDFLIFKEIYDSIIAHVGVKYKWFKKE